jgi:hypothetical protein
MGVIRKKIAARGGEGGVKYVCDVCSADITSTVRPCHRQRSSLMSPEETPEAHDACLRTVEQHHLNAQAKLTYLPAGPYPMRPQRLQRV